MAAVISNSLKNLSAFLQDHQVSFSNGLLILFTIGGEQIFRFNAFKCPCNHDEAYNYALIFMFAPAIILGILGVVVSNLTWRILHGCQGRSEKTSNGCCKSSGYLCMVLARAAVVPGAWLFIALLDGNYFACMMAEKPCEKILEGGKEKDTDEILHYKAMSQNIAWISLGGVILVSFVVICIVRCCDDVTYVQYKFLNAYLEAEQDQIDKQIQISTKEKAESNVKVFVDKEKEERMNKSTWDEISKVPDLTLSKKESKDEGDNLKTPSAAVGYLTPLHKWAREQIQMTQLQAQAPETHEQQDNSGQQRQEASEVVIQVQAIP